MKRTVPFFFFLSLLSLPLFGQKHFDQSIFVPKDLPTNVMESVKDMAYWLQKITGNKYNILQSDPNNKVGIQISWINEKDLSRSQKDILNKDGQSFYLCIKGEGCANIIGTGVNSFNNGIYTFLHELGFRWFMPGDVWAIVPSDFPKDLQINKVYTPDFQNRSYFGTGGVNAIKNIDPENSFKKDYEIWNRRNRFSSDYKEKGHTGQLFYTDNKEELESNPGYFCNNVINRYGRINISNTKAVDLYIKWAKEQIKPGDKFPVIGVDPADGSGGKDDCLPENMPIIKTWSDKYFWLANQVSKNLDKNDKKTKVQLYAYASHAATPTFKLEKHVYPIIIPYAFQRTSSPVEFIKTWSEKLNGRPMGMYDYWNITQWSTGIPQFNIYTIPQKLKLWKHYNVTSINLETTNGKGATGHVLWLASQMMWNTHLSFDSLYNDFLTRSFGVVASDVKKLYDRWSKNYQNEMEVGLSLQDLARASSKTKDKKIQARLNELKAYVHYLKLYYDYQANPTSIDVYEELVIYIHSIHHLRLVQSSAILERYIIKPIGYKNLATREITPISEIQIQSQFQKNLDNNKVNYLISDFEFDIKKAQPLKLEPVSAPKFLIGRNNYQFYIASPKEFIIKAGSTQETSLTIISSDDKVSLDEKITASKENLKLIKLKLLSGIYTLSFGDYSRFSRLEFPADIVFMSSGVSFYDNYGYPLHYVYVPKNVEEIIYQDNLGPGINKRGYWLNPDGERSDPIQIKNKVYRVSVPAKYRGKIWTLNIGHRQFELLNIPNRFSLRKFEYVE